ncbi:hypothetical protein BB560_003996 [Smittium megazygosporum]|uniref:PH domain-containing protein n=1 Tax=Smittium megazygosporum TaxID=133381 RepID=A0A2T9ZAF5_9FUNG|nr:hypothetical protein BB560_003996 [Smittium megazygosporum]
MDLNSVKFLFQAHKSKLYYRGVLAKKNDLAANGKPYTMRKWTRWYVEIQGSFMMFWSLVDPALEEHSSSVSALIENSLNPSSEQFLEIANTIKGAVKKPNFINISNATCRIIGSRNSRNGIWELQTSGANRFFMQASSQSDLVNWILAIRLSTFELSILHEAYTTYLINSSFSFPYTSPSYNSLLTPARLRIPGSNSLESTYIQVVKFDKFMNGEIIFWKQINPEFPPSNTNLKILAKIQLVRALYLIPDDTSLSAIQSLTCKLEGDCYIDNSLLESSDPPIQTETIVQNVTLIFESPSELYQTFLNISEAFALYGMPLSFSPRLNTQSPDLLLTLDQLENHNLENLDNYSAHCAIFDIALSFANKQLPNNQSSVSAFNQAPAKHPNSRVPSTTPLPEAQLNTRSLTNSKSESNSTVNTPTSSFLSGPNNSYTLPEKQNGMPLDSFLKLEISTDSNFKQNSQFQSNDTNYYKNIGSSKSFIDSSGEVTRIEATHPLNNNNQRFSGQSNQQLYGFNTGASNFLVNLPSESSSEAASDSASNASESSDEPLSAFASSIINNAKNQNSSSLPSTKEPSEESRIKSSFEYQNDSLQKTALLYGTDDVSLATSPNALPTVPMQQYSSNSSVVLPHDPQLFAENAYQQQMYYNPIQPGIEGRNIVGDQTPYPDNYLQNQMALPFAYDGAFQNIQGVYAQNPQGIQYFQSQPDFGIQQLAQTGYPLYYGTQNNNINDVGALDGPLLNISTNEKQLRRPTGLVGAIANKEQIKSEQKYSDSSSIMRNRRMRRAVATSMGNYSSGHISQVYPNNMGFENSPNFSATPQQSLNNRASSFFVPGTISDNKLEPFNGIPTPGSFETLSQLPNSFNRAVTTRYSVGAFLSNSPFINAKSFSVPSQQEADEDNVPLSVLSNNRNSVYLNSDKMNSLSLQTQAREQPQFGPYRFSTAGFNSGNLARKTMDFSSTPHFENSMLPNPESAPNLHSLASINDPLPRLDTSLNSKNRNSSISSRNSSNSTFESQQGVSPNIKSSRVSKLFKTEQLKSGDENNKFGSETVALKSSSSNIDKKQNTSVNTKKSKQNPSYSTVVLEYSYAADVPETAAATFEKFLEQRVDSKPFNWIHHKEVYQSYQGFCMKQRVKKDEIVSIEVFISMMKSVNYPLKVNKYGENCFYNISVLLN